MDRSKRQWIHIKEAAAMLGMTYRGASLLARQGKFPVKTYKLGRMRVLSRVALEKFFEKKNAEALAALEAQPEPAASPEKEKPPTEGRRQRKKVES